MCLTVLLLYYNLSFNGFPGYIVDCCNYKSVWSYDVMTRQRRWTRDRLENINGVEAFRGRPELAIH